MLDTQVNLIDNARKMVIEGHRGGRLDYENTMGGFEKAYQNGVKSIEFDLWLTKDYVPVVIHGSNDGRVMHVNADLGITEDTFLNTVTLEQLKQVELPNGESIPTFAELLDYGFGKFHFNCEIKEFDPKIVQILLDLMASKGVTSKDAHFSSFKHYHLKELYKLAPDFEYSYLIEPAEFDDMQGKDSYSGSMVAINHHNLSKEFVQSCHKNSKKVVVWFSGEYPEKQEYYQNMVEWGVDTIITDRPVEINDFLDSIILEESTQDSDE